ncbi:hypothetical protein BCF33_1512 [Hasllibacter halocynthiae]|uniref:Lipoprotein n=1 Tax=Hasllibacter halocynthiae TaxID=595589 RepID=A0A2T0X135_9RHOB|nr:hypothetical protein [Hasllibacter halocynthiae]PRY92659.1 hypothetical protein BCF33_1512 [Hasllibacter halocynthiae]
MNIRIDIALAAGALALTGCAGTTDQTRDGGLLDRGDDLSTLQAGIWIDPNGCDHWIIDDGVEGYLSPRLAPDGRPVCSGAGQPGFAVGPFRQGFDRGRLF